MAKMKNVSFIESLSGRSGDIVLYNRKGRQCVRKYVVPANPDSEARRRCRNSMKDAVTAWQSVTAEEKAAYNRRANRSKKNLTGYNLFVSEYIKQSGNRP